MTPDEAVYLVVSLPKATPRAFPRPAFPLHLTNVPEFRIDTSEREVARVVGGVAQRSRPFAVTGGERAMFGLSADVPVRLVHGEAADEIHRALLDALDGHVSPLVPKFCGSGYRPHMSDRPGAAVDRGEVVQVSSVSLLSMRADRVEIIDTYLLEAE